MTPEAQQLARGFTSALRFVGGQAKVVRTGTEAAAAIEDALGRDEAGRAVLYEPSPLADRIGLPLALRARGLELLPAAAAGARIDKIRVGITPATLGIAETGTILVGGQPGGWGLTTILPWVHVALLDAGDIVADLASAFGRFHERFAAGERDWVWISGPSKTADIAKTLVMGIHGPNQVRVLIVDNGGGAGGGD